MIRVLLVDDHHLVRVGLAALLAQAGEIVVVGEAEDGRAAITAVTSCAPDLVLMDLSMPGMDGIEATRAILAAHPGLRVLVLTSFADRDRVREAVAAGAIGYVLKDSHPDALLAAVRAAAAGHVPLDPRVAGALLPTEAGAAGAPSGVGSLSPREIQVLELVARGLANKQIGRALGITERTVKAHLGRVFRALGVADRTSAALWAREHLT